MYMLHWTLSTRDDEGHQIIRAIGTRPTSTPDANRALAPIRYLAANGGKFSAWVTSYEPSRERVRP